MNRRGFLAGLGALIMAPAVLHLPLEMTPRGIIVPTPNLRLVEFRRQIIEEYVRENLFSPYRIPVVEHWRLSAPDFI